MLLAAGANPSTYYIRDRFFNRMAPCVEALLAEPCQGQENWLAIFGALLDAGADIDTPFRNFDGAPTARLVAPNDYPEAFTLIERKELDGSTGREAASASSVKPAKHKGL